MLRVMGLATNVLGLAAFVLWLVYLVSVGAALAITTAAALLLAMSLMAAAAASVRVVLFPAPTKRVAALDISVRFTMRHALFLL